MMKVLLVRLAAKTHGEEPLGASGGNSLPSGSSSSQDVIAVADVVVCLVGHLCRFCWTWKMGRGRSAGQRASSRRHVKLCADAVCHRLHNLAASPQRLPAHPLVGQCRGGIPAI